MTPESFDDPVYTVNRISLKGYSTVDQTTRKYTFQTFTSLPLAHYKCPERHLHNEILEIDQTTLVTAILILSVIFAPLTPIMCHENSSSPVSAPECICRLNSDNPIINYSIQILESISLPIVFFFFFRVKCDLAYLGQTKSLVPNIGLAVGHVYWASITENFLYLSFINWSAVHVKYMRWCEYLASPNVRKG